MFHYGGDYYAGQAAVTIHAFGKEHVIYVGTMGEASFYAAAAGWISELAGLTPLLETPPGVEAAERWQGEQKLLFILNHTEQEQVILLDGRYTNLLTGETIQDSIIIAATDLALLAA